MRHEGYEHIDDAFLSGVTSDFISSRGTDLLGRWDAHGRWCNGRLRNRIEPFSKTILSGVGTEVTSCQRDMVAFSGVNFGSQDYLSLAGHPAIRAAATEAASKFGVHSAGSAALMGNTGLSVELERQLADFLGYADCTVFPTGWGAGYGTIKTLVRPTDHIVIDVLAHACLREGARNATANVHTFPHLSNKAVERRLKRIREEDAETGILVVTETVFSMDSDVPDLAELQAICSRHRAVLMVDVAHDLGCIGPTGRGILELQGMAGRVDLVMGSFSKTFASNGGFVATNSPALKLALRYNCGPLTFTNALSPIQAAVVLEALDIVRSPEGAERRECLMTNILELRAKMEGEGFRLLGQPSAIVPVILGDSAASRLTTRYALASGGIVNLVEYPAVSRNTCRWRLQVMADHKPGDIERFVRIAVGAREQARAHLAFLGEMRTEAVPA